MNIRRYDIAVEYIEELFTARDRPRVLCKNPLPKDASIIHIKRVPGSNILSVFFQHPSFEGASQDLFIDDLAPSESLVYERMPTNKVYVCPACGKEYGNKDAAMNCCKEKDQDDN